MRRSPKRKRFESTFVCRRGVVLDATHARAPRAPEARALAGRPARRRPAPRAGGVRGKGSCALRPSRASHGARCFPPAIPPVRLKICRISGRLLEGGRGSEAPLRLRLARGAGGEFASAARSCARRQPRSRTPRLKHERCEKLRGQWTRGERSVARSRTARGAVRDRSLASGRGAAVEEEPAE